MRRVKHGNSLDPHARPLSVHSSGRTLSSCLRQLMRLAASIHAVLTSGNEREDSAWCISVLSVVGEMVSASMADCRPSSTMRGRLMRSTRSWSYWRGRKISSRSECGSVGRMVGTTSRLTWSERLMCAACSCATTRKMPSLSLFRRTLTSYSKFNQMESYV